MLYSLPTPLLGQSWWFGGAEEAVQSVSGLLGSLYREKVSGFEGTSLNIIALPSSTYQVSSAPQDKERTDYATPARTVHPIMLAIYARTGSILLTDGVCVARISKGFYVSGADLKREHSRGRAPSA
jgi:hypothetical protein